MNPAHGFVAYAHLCPEAARVRSPGDRAIVGTDVRAIPVPHHAGHHGLGADVITRSRVALPGTCDRMRISPSLMTYAICTPGRYSTRCVGDKPTTGILLLASRFLSEASLLNRGHTENQKNSGQRLEARCNPAYPPWVRGSSARSGMAATRHGPVRLVLTPVTCTNGSSCSARQRPSRNRHLMPRSRGAGHHPTQSSGQSRPDSRNAPPAAERSIHTAAPTHPNWPQN